MSIARLSSYYAVSPQIRPEDMSGIAASGFRAIVNNRPDAEAPDQPGSVELEAEAKRLGMGYAYIPVVPGQLNEAPARSLGQFLGGVDGPVLGFCRTGTRSAGLWALAQASHGNVVEIMEAAARAGYDLSSLRTQLDGAAAGRDDA